MRVIDLVPAYYSATGQNIAVKDFSSKLSIRAANEDSKIKLAKLIDKQFEYRFWWGLKEWFEGDVLKPEFTDKIDQFIAKTKSDLHIKSMRSD